MKRDAAYSPSSMQRDRVRRQIIEGVVRIRSEIRGNYDPETGLYSYKANRGRLTEAEVLRRSGGIDKNTIKRPYHAKSRKTVALLVRWAKAKCEPYAGATEERQKHREEARQEEVTWLKQALGASEARRDIAEIKAEAARRDEQLAIGEAVSLRNELDDLKRRLFEIERRV